MAPETPDLLSSARRTYAAWSAAMLALYAIFFVFCFFVPIVDPSGGRWYPRTRMNLFYWQRTPDGVSIKFSHQLGSLSPAGYHIVEYNSGFKQIPQRISPLISAMYVSEHWLIADRRPPDMNVRFDEALAAVEDEREAYSLNYCFVKGTRSGRILWLGVIRNLAVLVLLLALVISIVKSSRASTNVRAVKLALRKSSCLCGYSLVGLLGDKCPECGRPIAVLSAQPPTTLDA